MMTKLMKRTLFFSLILFIFSNITLAQLPAEAAKVMDQAAEKYLKGDYKGAIKMFDVAIEKHRVFDAHVSKGFCYLALGNYDQAIECAKIYKSAAPSSSRPSTLMAMTYNAAGDKQRAGQYFREAARLEPDYYSVQEDYLTFLSNNRIYKGAEIQAELMIEKWPDSLYPHIELAMACAWGGKPEKGLPILDSLIKTGRHSSYLYHQRAEARHNAGMQREAIEDYYKSSELHPEKKLNVCGISLCYEALKEYDQALKFCDECIALAGPNSEYKQNKAMILASMKRFDDAEKIMLEMIKKDPDISYLKSNLAYIYTLAEKYKEAVELLEPVLEPTPFNAYAYNNMGYAKYMIGRKEDGIADIKLSLKLDPTNSYAHYNRARVYIAENDLASACIALESAKELNFTGMYGPEVDQLIEKYCK